MRAVLERTAKEFRENVLSRHFYDNHKFPGVRTILARAGLAPVTEPDGDTGPDNLMMRAGAGKTDASGRRNKLSAPLMKQI